VVAEIVYPWVLLLALLILMFLTGLVTLLLLVIGNGSGLSSPWTFGQLLPMFLIVLPFYQLVETYVGTCQLPPELTGETRLIISNRGEES
jgi:hypothetical protein